MAKVKFSALISEMRNKLNGSVFSKNRAGNYLRNKVTPVNPQTSFQQAARNLLTSFSQAWRALTQAQIAAWNNAVENFQTTDIFGDSRKPSGKNLYSKLNINLALVGVAAINDPPLPGSVEAPTLVTVSANGTVPAMSIVFAPTPVPADTAFIVRATRPISPGKSFVKSEYRVIAVRDAASISPYNALADYTAKFGPLITGEKVFVSLEPVNKITGQAGTQLSAFTIII
jgi:hypothetical protein